MNDLWELVASSELWGALTNHAEKTGSSLATDLCKQGIKTAFTFAAQLTSRRAGIPSIGEAETSRIVEEIVAAFVITFEAELRASETSAIGSYAVGIQDLLQTEAIHKELARPLFAEKISAHSFDDVWAQLGLRKLPEYFSWNVVVRETTKRANEIIIENPAARRKAADVATLKAAEHLESLANALNKSQTSPLPLLDYSGYRLSLENAYRHLKLHHLAVEGETKTPLALRKVFEEQSVIEQKHLPKEFYDLPVEIQECIRKGDYAKLPHLDLLAQFQKWHEAFKSTTARRGLDFLEDQLSRLVTITGDPGSGKSSLLQFSALLWAEHGNDSDPLPIIIELRKFAEHCRDLRSCTDFLEYLSSGQALDYHFNREALQHRFITGPVSLYLDGLDEVFEETQREAVLALISRTATKFPHLRIVVTSRPIGYQPEYLQERHFKHGHLQSFSDDQVFSFLKKWHVALDESDRQILHDQLAKQLKNQMRLRELAGNPLLLTMMALLNRTTQLPDRRAELYERCVHLLCYQWDVNCHRIKAANHDMLDARLLRRSLNDKEKRALLRSIAFTMQSSANGLGQNVIDAEDLEQTIAANLPAWIPESERSDFAKSVVAELRGRNYIIASLGGGRFGFVHRTFLEFCCADYFIHQMEKSGELNPADLFLTVFEIRLRRPEWREVLLLIASQLEEKRLKLVLKPLVGVLQMHPSDVLLLGFICALIGESDSREYHEDLIKTVWNIAVQLVETPLHSLNSGEWHQSNREIVALWEDSIRAISVGWGGRKILRDWLTSISDSASANGAKRNVALECLSQGWPHDEDVRIQLDSISASEGVTEVRMKALRLIGECFRSNPATRELLERIASDERDDDYVRVQALEVLANTYEKDDRMVSLFRKCANDNDPLVHQCAHVLLEGMWTNDVPGLIARVMSASKWEQRMAALDRLVHLKPDNTELMPIIAERAVKDPDWPMRHHCIELAGQHFSGDRRTVTLLLDRADQDSHAKVRRHASTELAKRFGRNFEVIERLQWMANSHKRADVRANSCTTLAEINRSDPTLRKFMEKLIAKERDILVTRVLAGILGH